MRKTEINPDAAFQSLTAEAYLTGLSPRYIRNGCREGRIPHIKIGGDYRVDHAAFMEQLRAESRSNGAAS